MIATSMLLNELCGSLRVLGLRTPDKILHLLSYQIIIKWPCHDGLAWCRFEATILCCLLIVTPNNFESIYDTTELWLLFDTG